MKIKDISYYLFESYRDAVEKFSQEEDKETVNQYLDSFKQLAKKGIVAGQEKDIGYWIKQGWYEFKEFVDSKSQEKTKGQVKKSKKKESIIVHDDEVKMVVIPLTKDASCFYGKGTKWCTSATESKNYFIKYFYLSKIVLIYVFMKNSGDKYAAAYSKDSNKFEYFNELDQNISPEEFENNTKTTISEIKSWVEDNKVTILEAMSLNSLSKEGQIEAVKDVPIAIQYIDKPDEEIQLAAVQETGEVIEYIENPSETVQLAAIENFGISIKYINNPSEKVQLAAISGEMGGPSYIKYIKKPTEEIQLSAVQQRGEVIKDINNPSEKVQLAAVQENGFSIEYIRNPSEKVQLAAVQENAFSIAAIKNPSEKVQLAAVEKSGEVLVNIDNPSEEVQLAAVKNLKYSIEFIDNPTEKVKKIHQELWGDK